MKFIKLWVLGSIYLKLNLSESLALELIYIFRLKTLQIKFQFLGTKEKFYWKPLIIFLLILMQVIWPEAISAFYNICDRHGFRAEITYSSVFLVPQV